MRAARKRRRGNSVGGSEIGGHHRIGIICRGVWRQAVRAKQGLIVEIVAPGTDIPLPLGHHGEIVITRLNGDYPLLRFGTGDLSTLRTGISPCGRTNYRLDAQITSTP